jgi:hypothetical protein
MSLYLKKVDAIQFTLTDDQKELVKNRNPVFFEGSAVKHVGGDQYIAVLQQGENLIKIHSTQWLVRHSDGLWQIFWPDKFNAIFIKGDATESFEIKYDPFQKTRPINQPTIIS